VREEKPMGKAELERLARPDDVETLLNHNRKFIK
jgi:hypothetical protein